MCGRYTHKLTWRQIYELYGLMAPAETPPGLRESYNVAPTHVMPIIRPHGNGRELVMAGWGLVPFWLKSLDRPAYSTINARAETVQTAPTYRQPFAKRRCIVPATGWYEWQDMGKKAKKKPFHMCPRTTPFAFAGVWDEWKGADGPGVTSFAIVTTDAAPSVRQYHARMPVILEANQFEDWMRGPPDLAAEMMKPYGGGIEVCEVGTGVNNVKNNRPDLMERVGLL